ncbi:hypothetical protein M3Y99_01795200 [Aphelenchoides fujianensis]|nr:hypothetical protein M3Y99_01795200 [Aphelenchoides fujianensis]
MLPIGLFNKHDLVMSWLGLFANLLLFYIIRRRTGASFRSYSQMITLCCANDIIYSIVALCCRRVIELRNGNLFHMGYGFEERSGAGNGAQTSTILPTQYYFRYIIVSNSLDSAKRGREYYAKQLGPEWLEEDGRLHLSSVNDIRDFSTILHFGVGTVIIFTSYGIVTYYGYKTLNLMRNPVPGQMISKNTKAMINQFTRNLFISTGISIVCAVLPATWLFVYVVFKPEIPSAGVFVSSIYTYNPLANALVAMLVIRPYREHLLRMLTFGKRKGGTSSVGAFTKNQSVAFSTHSHSKT